MLANINKTKLALAVVAAATAFTAPVVSAAEKSELTVVPNFYPTMVRNFNPYLSTNLHTTSDFVYEPLVVFNFKLSMAVVFLNLTFHTHYIARSQF